MPSKRKKWGIEEWAFCVFASLYLLLMVGLGVKSHQYAQACEARGGEYISTYGCGHFVPLASQGGSDE